MKKPKQTELDFIIDRLTNSIINVISGDSFQTEVARLSKADLKNITKNNGWNFNWKSEFQDISKEVYKLTIVGNPTIIQGLLSISIMNDHVYMNLLENAPFNIGKAKLYEGVTGNLVAYACKVSFQKGFDGYVAFVAKSKLIQHYEKTLGAYHFKDQKMFIETEPAKLLVEKYFKE
ncbi:MAG: hypothetical protein KF781_08625 [Chitinophagaceae bacterium]|nr:hypothetical protein [Chitinophagaceae bacterium]